MSEKTKIYIYNKNGQMIKEYFENDFIIAFNEIVSNNIKNESDKWNLIYGFEFPPEGLIWKNGEWINDKKKFFDITRYDIKNFFKDFI